MGYRAGRDAPKSPASSARTDQLIKVVGGAIIAQARTDGALEDVAGAAALVMDPLVDVSILGALAALGVVVAGEEIAAAAEKRLAHEVHGTPDEQVVEWGGPIGSHGADVVSVDTKTGRVTLWDAKYRKGRLKIDKSGKPERKDVKITASSTFKAGSRARANAIKGAERAISSDKTLPPAIRAKALANLDAGRIRTITKGFGKAKNQVIGK